MRIVLRSQVQDNANIIAKQLAKYNKRKEYQVVELGSAYLVLESSKVRA